MHLDRLQVDRTWEMSGNLRFEPIRDVKGMCCVVEARKQEKEEAGVMASWAEASPCRSPRREFRHG